jgi:hypothetical protein
MSNLRPKTLSKDVLYRIKSHVQNHQIVNITLGLGSCKDDQDERDLEKAPIDFLQKTKFQGFLIERVRLNIPERDEDGEVLVKCTEVEKVQELYYVSTYLDDKNQLQTKDSLILIQQIEHNDGNIYDSEIFEIVDIIRFKNKYKEMAKKLDLYKTIYISLERAISSYI